MKNCVSLRVGAAGVGHRQLIGAGEGQLLDIFIGERRPGWPLAAGSVHGRRPALNDVNRSRRKSAHDRGKNLPVLI